MRYKWLHASTYAIFCHYYFIFRRQTADHRIERDEKWKNNNRKTNDKLMVWQTRIQVKNSNFFSMFRSYSLRSDWILRLNFVFLRVFFFIYNFVLFVQFLVCGNDLACGHAHFVWMCAPIVLHTSMKNIVDESYADTWKSKLLLFNVIIFHRWACFFFFSFYSMSSQVRGAGTHNWTKIITSSTCVIFSHSNRRHFSLHTAHENVGMRRHSWHTFGLIICV